MCWGVGSEGERRQAVVTADGRRGMLRETEKIGACPRRAVPCAAFLKRVDPILSLTKNLHIVHMK